MSQKSQKKLQSYKKAAKSCHDVANSVTFVRAGNDFFPFF